MLYLPYLTDFNPGRLNSVIPMAGSHTKYYAHLLAYSDVGKSRVTLLSMYSFFSATYL